MKKTFITVSGAVITLASLYTTGIIGPMASATLAHGTTAMERLRPIIFPAMPPGPVSVDPNTLYDLAMYAHTLSDLNSRNVTVAFGALTALAIVGLCITICGMRMPKKKK
jgi:hypothetical protein